MNAALYRLFAAARSITTYLRGDVPLQPTYMEGQPRRVRRSLLALGDCFTHGWPGIATGKFSGAMVAYAATIGEFHPLVPVIEACRERNPALPLVIFAGQLQYIDAIHAAMPEAAVGVLPPGAPWLYDRLFQLLQPRLVALGEGPCANLHFPIRFDLALAAACVGHDVPMVVVNATMHKYMCPSRLDLIEDRWFGELFSSALKYCYAPNDTFKSWLVNGGVPESKVIVTGDLRFDNLRPLPDTNRDLAQILAALRAQNVPIVVAGSVNAIDEESAVIDGWLQLRSKHPGARLVIAPRHVNNPQNMKQLYDYFDAKGVTFARRSTGIEASTGAEALVVDVFGELPHFYSVASVAYIGRNHGVLEPLRFRVPTVVAPRGDWAPEYVTFPYYMQMIQAGGIIEADSKDRIGELFLRAVDDRAYAEGVVENAVREAEKQVGAGARIADHIATHMK